jgi:hypothetical protein
VPQGREPAAVFLTPEDQFKLEYESANAYILHCSSVRSALASFLITVALASFAAYYSAADDKTSSSSSSTSTTVAAPAATGATVGPGPITTAARNAANDRAPYLLAFAAYLFLGAAVFSSLRFSYLTERATVYSIELWKWGVEGKRGYPGGFRSRDWEHPGELRRRVSEDRMNWLLVAGAIALAVAFPVLELLT